ncbi:hypothetical protein CRENBAI_003524 [Crenichthys baileyi]|uniref:Uncharacterized protein n=1 Tax=Crenichthys baileyi TaxID=28760 RepID=A0AAV9R3D5_9TELE
MELADSRQESARDRWVQQQMEEAMKHLPTDLEVVPSPLLLEEMELGPAGPGSGRGVVDLFTFLSREAEKTLRRSAGLSVPQSAYDGSRLAIPCPGTGPLRRCSLPAPLAAPSPSSCRKKRRRGAPSCSAGEEVVCLPADAFCNSAHAVFAPSSRCSEATPDELEERLRFFARQIKTFRRTSLMYSSPELMERIRQMERDYETAVRQFYCRPPSTPGFQGAAAAAEQSTPGLQGAASAAEQSTPGLQPAVELSEGLEGELPPLPGPEHLLNFLWGLLMELKPDTPRPVSARPDSPRPVSARPDSPRPVSARPDSPRPVSARPDSPRPVSARPDSPRPVSARPDSPRPDLKSASTSSTRPRGRRKRDASVHATKGPCNALALAHITECPADALAPSLQGFSGKLVLVLASEPCDEGRGLRGGRPPDPVSGDFKEEFVLVLASEPRDEGSPGSASASEGSPGGFARLRFGL